MYTYIVLCDCVETVRVIFSAFGSICHFISLYPTKVFIWCTLIFMVILSSQQN